MHKKLLACVSLLCISFASSNSAHAANTWFNNVTLDTTYYFWDGSVDVWGVSWLETLNTGCAVSDSQKKAVWFNGGAGTHAFTIGNTRLGPALMALGSGLKVDLYLDPANCTAYGAALHGIRIRRQ